jgi:hypothetical protein
MAAYVQLLILFMQTSSFIISSFDPHDICRFFPIAVFVITWFRSENAFHIVKQLMMFLKHSRQCFFALNQTTRKFFRRKWSSKTFDDYELKEERQGDAEVSIATITTLQPP